MGWSFSPSALKKRVGVILHLHPQRMTQRGAGKYGREDVFIDLHEAASRTNRPRSRDSPRAPWRFWNNLHLLSRVIFMDFWNINTHCFPKWNRGEKVLTGRQRKRLWSTGCPCAGNIIQIIKQTHPFNWINVNVGEEQLVTVRVLSCPVSEHFFDVGKVANKTCGNKQEVSSCNISPCI